MSKTLTVEGDVGTVDSRTNITTQGSVTAPSLVVPSGVTKIDKLITAATAEGLADGSAALLVRIGGGAVKRGEQNIIVGACARIAPQAGSDSAPQIGQLFVLKDVDIEVNASDNLTISAEMMGSDVGTVHIGITIVFG
jgi:hypothetical protein